MAAASVRGAAHERTGAPCQDAHYWVTAAGGVLVAAVADGAGSVPLADMGAGIAARTAVKSIHEKLKTFSSDDLIEDADWERLLTDSLAEAKAAVESEASARSVPGSDLASTLILVAASRDVVAAVQIGDGATIASDAEGSMVAVTRPPAGEYLNETTFLSSSAGLASARPVVWRGCLKHLAVMSDGLQMVALRMPGAEPHPGFFRPLFRFLEERGDRCELEKALVSFLGSPRLRERTDDDVTLIVAALAAGGCA